MQKNLIRRVLTHPIYLVAFGFGAGLSPIAPGTCGTLVAIPLYYLIRPFSLLNYGVVLLLGVLVGVWICDVTERDFGVRDYSGVVWDEICGFCLSMWAAPSGYLALFIGFILFRGFDILKPWPIAAVERWHGGLGIMADDLIAGSYAWFFLHSINHFWGHKIFV